MRSKTPKAMATAPTTKRPATRSKVLRPEPTLEEMADRWLEEHREAMRRLAEL